MLRLGGILPALDRCSSCARAYDERGAILPRGGESFVCHRCARGGLEISSDVLLAVAMIQTSRLETLQTEGFSVAVLDRIERLSAGIRRYFLQRELKSYKVMRETLAGT